VKGGAAEGVDEAVAQGVGIDTYTHIYIYIPAACLIFV